MRQGEHTDDEATLETELEDKELSEEELTEELEEAGASSAFTALGSFTTPTTSPLPPARFFKMRVDEPRLWRGTAA